jgi:hypothetical protein
MFRETAVQAKGKNCSIKSVLLTRTYEIEENQAFKTHVSKAPEYSTSFSKISATGTPYANSTSPTARNVSRPSTIKLSTEQ